MKEITLLPRELKGLMGRLRMGRPIYITSNEKERYQVGELVKSPLGILKVEEVKVVDEVEDHPFLNQLTEEERALITAPFDVIRMTWVRNPGAADGIE